MAGEQNRPEKNNQYYLNMLRHEIDGATNYGEDSNQVYLHGETSLFNVRKNAKEGYYEMERLIVTAGTPGEYPTKIVYYVAENSTAIYQKEWFWDGNSDEPKEFASLYYSLNEDVYKISRLVLDGLRLDDQEAQKYLRKHRRIMNHHYGEDHDLGPGPMTKLFSWIFGEPKTDT